MNDVCQKLENRGLDCRVLETAAGQMDEDRISIDDHVIVLLEGRLEVEIDGEVFLPQPGEELLVPAGAMHGVRTVEGASRWVLATGRV